MVNYEDVLAQYTLAEIIDINGWSEEDILELLVEEGHIILPVVI